MESRNLRVRTSIRNLFLDFLDGLMEEEMIAEAIIYEKKLVASSFSSGLCRFGGSLDFAFWNVGCITEWCGAQ